VNWYFGDLHCHTNLSYGRGTMERAFEIGRTHLDFCTVTGHAFWPDMPEDLQHYDPTISLHMGGLCQVPEILAEVSGGHGKLQQF